MSRMIKEDDKLIAFYLESLYVTEVLRSCYGSFEDLEEMDALMCKQKI